MSPGFPVKGFLKLKIVVLLVTKSRLAGPWVILQEMVRGPVLVSESAAALRAIRAMAGITIAYNDKPLTAEQMQAEEGRLADFVSHPELLRRKHFQEQESAERTLRIVKALPDAFLFDYDGEQPGTADLGKDGDWMVRLKFRPNPASRPAFPAPHMSSNQRSRCYRFRRHP